MILQLFMDNFSSLSKKTANQLRAVREFSVFMCVVLSWSSCRLLYCLYTSAINVCVDARQGPSRLYV